MPSPTPRPALRRGLLVSALAVALASASTATATAQDGDGTVDDPIEIIVTGSNEPTANPYPISLAPTVRPIEPAPVTDVGGTTPLDGFTVGDLLAVVPKCLDNTVIADLYLPASLLDGAQANPALPQQVKDALSQVDLDADRGWKIGQISLRQELRVNRSTGTIESVVAYPSAFVSATAGVVGLTVTPGVKVDGAVGGTSARSQAQFAVAFQVPLSPTAPANTNYQLTVLGNANGQVDVAPGKDNPDIGLYTDVVVGFGC